MSKRAMQFDEVAHTFESYIASGSASLAHAFTMLSQIMTAAGAFFPGGSPIVIEPPSLASGGTIQSSGLAFLHAGEQVIPAAQVSQGGTGGVNITINAGTVVHESQLPDMIVRALTEAYKRGKIANSVFTGQLALSR